MLGTGSRRQKLVSCRFRKLRDMVLRCGEARVLEAWQLQFGARFSLIQKATLGTSSGRGGRWRSQSVLQCHAVSVWREVRFGGLRGTIWSWFHVDSESDVRHQQRQAEVTIRPSVPCCFGVARCPFWRPESCNLELVSIRFRKRRWAPAAAGGGHNPPFSAMLFRGWGSVLEAFSTMLFRCREGSVLEA